MEIKSKVKSFRFSEATIKQLEQNVTLLNKQYEKDGLRKITEKEYLEKLISNNFEKLNNSKSGSSFENEILENLELIGETCEAIFRYTKLLICINNNIQNIDNSPDRAILIKRMLGLYDGKINDLFEEVIQLEEQNEEQ